MNEEYIAIGMVNAKIHVFEAKKGKFLRTLVGHEAGVWTSVLVTTQLPDTSQSMDTEDEPSFNMGSIGQDPESRGKSTKSRRRARADTRRASFDDNGIRSGNQHSRPRRAGDPVLGSTDPNGPFGPRYPGVEMIGNKYRHTDTTNTARGWGQDRTLILSGGCDRIFRVWDIATGSVTLPSVTAYCNINLSPKQAMYSRSRGAYLHYPMYLPSTGKACRSHRLPRFYASSMGYRTGSFASSACWA
jgi:F-box and WD-40 domain protein CDC4